MEIKKTSDSANHNSPLFNLSVVLYETGLKADVLRAWERRYGLPTPQRSSGGHRLYSRHDIETIKWLQTRKAEGMSIRRATVLWKELINTGRDPFNVYKWENVAAQNSRPVEGWQLESLRNKWLEACLTFNRRQADDILNEAFALYPIEQICVEILQQGLHEVGERWYRGLATVQQEHFVSAQVVRRVEALINATPNPTREQTILIGCPPGELHTYPSLFMGLVLRRRGYRVIDLGADIPLEQMPQTLTAIRPDLVVLSAQQFTTAAAIFSTAHLLQKEDITLAYGGQIFNRIPALCMKINAHFLGEKLPEALMTIERLLAGDHSLPTVGDAVDVDHALVARYQENRPRIEMMVLEQRAELQIKQLKDMNAFLEDRINAALVFGEPALIKTDLDWLKELLSTRGVPLGLFGRYLENYVRALEHGMGEAAAPIASSMKDFASRIGKSDK